VSHLLQIPPEGILHLFHSDKPATREYIDKVLGVGDLLGGGIGSAEIEVVYEERECQLYFVPDPDRGVNDRARALVADLFGWHMIFHGDVLIRDLTEDQVVEVMKKVASE